MLSNRAPMLSRHCSMRTLRIQALPDPPPSALRSPRPLAVSRELARHRDRANRAERPILTDPYAAALLATGPTDEVQEEPCTSHSPQHVAAATKHLDHLLLSAMAMTAVNRISKGDFRQVVIVGDGMDTRPFRLPWPTGTVLFLVAASECHELAEAVLKQAGAAVPRGCLLRRVNADLQRPGSSFAADLARAGFRGDRLSVWALQGLSGLSLGSPEVAGLFTDITNLAAFGSLVLGELPTMTKQSADNLLAEFGLLGATVSVDSVLTEATAPGAASPSLVGRSDPPESAGTSSMASAAQDFPAQPESWLFSSQQRRLSLAQMGIYESHRSEAEGLDEDFVDNFS